MKLNKPKTTKTNSDLQDYVSGLLFDTAGLSLDNAMPANVTPIKRNIPRTNTETKNVIEVLTDYDSTMDMDESSVVRSSEPDKAKKAEELIRSNKEAEPPTKVSLQKTELKNLEQANHQDITKDSLNELDDPRLKTVEKLLAKISLTKTPDQQPISPEFITDNPTSAETLSPIETSADKNHKEEVEPEELASNIQDHEEEQAQLIESTKNSFEKRENGALRDSLGGVFQTLVFEVSKLPLAVPLIKLGGIVNVSEDEITPLVGTPHWFMGLVPNERGNLMVVDTQKFLMPEKERANKDYKYLIILDDSQWALACHSVGDAKNLSPEEVRWSARSSKRPWFAGMVVEYMSALVEVDELINMLASNLSED